MCLTGLRNSLKYWAKSCLFSSAHFSETRLAYNLYHQGQHFPRSPLYSLHLSHSRDVLSICQIMREWINALNYSFILFSRAGSSSWSSMKPSETTSPKVFFCVLEFHAFLDPRMVMQDFWTLLNYDSLLTIVQFTYLLCLYTLALPVRRYSWVSGPARLPAFTFGFFPETQQANPCALAEKCIKATLTPASMIQHGDTLPAGLPWTSAPNLSSGLLPEP